MGHSRWALCVRFKGWFYFLIITRVFIPAHAPPNHSVLIRASAKLFFSAEWPLTVTAPCLYLAALRLSVDWNALLTEMNVIFKRINFLSGWVMLNKFPCRFCQWERRGRKITPPAFTGVVKNWLSEEGKERKKIPARLFFSQCLWLDEWVNM